jgi:UDP-3-O-[3-hydroxymyristoyl] N-acetylglucosamine deacetylase
VLRQQTIAETISCTGIGLHTGAPVHLTLRPASPGSGLAFVRTDVAHPVEIPVRPDAVATTSYATTLGRGDVTISTVEHLLSALYCLGVDNARIEVDGPEVPIMDGSAASFVFLIRAAGLERQPALRPRLKVRKRFEIREGERVIRVEPSRALRISYGIDFAHPAVGRQTLSSLALSDGSFEREICRARTFGFLHEVEALCWADEFVRHKVLDLVGDLALLGLPLEAHVEVERGGHALHQRLVSELLARPDVARVLDAPLRPGRERLPV